MGDRESEAGRGSIIISDREHALPFSKGLTANAIMAAGLSPARAYVVAQAVEDRLRESGRDSVTTEDLRRVTVDTIRAEAGGRYAEAYVKWQTVGGLEIPLIILIGGGTGVGKSTIATQLAARLGIVRIISSDAIREVMKGVFTPAIMPTLYRSSFNADEVVRARLPKSEDAVVVGFRDQVSAVSVGIRALIERAVTEGTDAIIEGAHVVPGFVTPEVGDRAIVVQLVLTVDDEDLHRSHFFVRAHETRSRPVERYLQHFANIRRIQKYVKSLALKHGIPVVPNYNLDATLASVIDLVMTRAEAAQDRAAAPVRTAGGGKR
ncbi:MAG: 2-phosphoglycerate kinase [Acidobacteria bacterium]|nr:2-phosphoglycerate kinase [Acidobacteriota bacterium]